MILCYFLLLKTNKTADYFNLLNSYKRAILNSPASCSMVIDTIAFQDREY